MKEDFKINDIVLMDSLNTTKIVGKVGEKWLCISPTFNTNSKTKKDYPNIDFSDAEKCYAACGGCDFDLLSLQEIEGSRLDKIESKPQFKLNSWVHTGRGLAKIIAIPLINHRFVPEGYLVRPKDKEGFTLRWTYQFNMHLKHAESKAELIYADDSRIRSITKQDIPFKVGDFIQINRDHCWITAIDNSKICVEDLARCGTSFSFDEFLDSDPRMALVDSKDLPKPKIHFKEQLLASSYRIGARKLSKAAHSHLVSMLPSSLSKKTQNSLIEILSSPIGLGLVSEITGLALKDVNHEVIKVISQELRVDGLTFLAEGALDLLSKDQKTKFNLNSKIENSLQEEQEIQEESKNYGYIKA